MTTEVDRYFSPYTPCTGESRVMPIWSEGCASPRIVATAPAIESGDSPDGTDSNGNTGLSCSPTGLIQTFLPEYMLSVQDDDRHCIANYLSSGEKMDLNITESNIHCYLQIAHVLNHITLKKLCEDFLQQNNKTIAWERNMCCFERTVNKVDKENWNIGHNNNCNKSHSCMNENVPKVPKFQIMFLKEMGSEDHNRVLVMDIRRMNEIQKIPLGKKVTGEGFSTCTAYIKQCPYVFLFGGYGKKKHSLTKYDVVENKWYTCAHLKQERTKHMMAFVNGRIYIIGGKCCGNKSVEVYDIESNHCSELSVQLPLGVHTAAHAVYENKIYIFGGKNIRGNVSSVQCIDTATNTISKVAVLPFECSGGQAIVVKDKIYFATQHGHMIKFDPVSNQSEMCSPQPYRRKNFVMFEKNGTFHLFGGIRTDGSIEHESTMFTYCPMENEWRRSLSFGLPLPVMASCTVVYPKECPVKPFMKLFGYC